MTTATRQNFYPTRFKDAARYYSTGRPVYPRLLSQRIAAVIGLTRAMAKEWGRYNVNVNAVGFGLIETRLTQALSSESAKVGILGHQVRLGVQPSMLESVKMDCPLGRLGTPEEAAGAVLFFCSPLSDYVTGEVLICGGGFHF